MQLLPFGNGTGSYRDCPGCNRNQYDQSTAYTPTAFLFTAASTGGKRKCGCCPLPGVTDETGAFELRTLQRTRLDMRARATLKTKAAQTEFTQARGVQKPDYPLSPEHVPFAGKALAVNRDGLDTCLLGCECAHS